jgi:dsRNA-specific ribonuclease
MVQNSFIANVAKTVKLDQFIRHIPSRTLTENDRAYSAMLADCFEGSLRKINEDFFFFLGDGRIERDLFLCLSISYAAFLGALFLDQTLAAVESFACTFLYPVVQVKTNNDAGLLSIDPKTVLRRQLNKTVTYKYVKRDEKKKKGNDRSFFLSLRSESYQNQELNINASIWPLLQLATKRLVSASAVAKWKRRRRRHFVH